MRFNLRSGILSVIGMLGVATALLYADGRLSAVVAAVFPESVGASMGKNAGSTGFPNIELTDQYGRKYKLYDDLLKGRAVAVNTFYSGCGDVCPLSTAKMLELQKLLGDRVGKDIFFYSLSIDPFNDTPEALKAYADRFNIGPGWLFLTGNEKDVQRATRSLGLGTLQSTSPRDDHSTTLMVGNEATKQWMKHSVTDNPRFVAASMRTFLGWPAGAEEQHYAQAAPIRNLTNGQFLFNNGCAACHNVGSGDKIGPDLLGVTERRKRDWLERFILTPDRVLAEKDPIAIQLLAKYKGVQMPNLGLARDEVGHILEYIDNRTAHVRQTAESAAVARSPAPGVASGDGDHKTLDHKTHDAHETHASQEKETTK